MNGVQAPTLHHREPGRLKLPAVLLVLLLSGVAWAQTYEVNTSGAAFREKPGRSGKQLRSLSQGERVQKVGEERGYFRVRAEKDGLEGYIAQSLLTEVREKKIEVPNYEDFIARLKEERASRTLGRPGWYFWETQFDFLHEQNWPQFVIILLLLLAIFTAGAGAYLLFRLWPGLEKVLPEELTGLRRQAVKGTALAAAGYAVLCSAAYFFDLALYHAILEENTLLLLIFSPLRLLLAAPVVLVDSMAANWLILVAGIVLFLLAAWPQWKGVEKKVEASTAVPGKVKTPVSSSAVQPSATRPKVKPPEPISAPASMPPSSCPPRPEEAPRASLPHEEGELVPETRIIAGDGEEDK